MAGCLFISHSPLLGLPGAFWFDLDKILATITEDDLKQKLQAFEQAQQETRDEAIAAALQRKAAATAEEADIR